MKQKNRLVIIGCIALFLIMLGLTYAYWLVTKSQTNTNQITAACLDISLTNEQNDIYLPDAIPMSDTDGMGLTPYTFTVTNNCNAKVDYQIALESMNISGKTTSDYLSSSSLKAVIDNNEAKKLNRYASVETTIDGAYESHKLITGTLAANGSANGSATHNLRVWIDKDAPVTEQSKVWNGKISVTIGQGIINPIKEGTLAYDILDNYGGEAAITSLSSKWVEKETEAETYSSIGIYANLWYGTDYEFNPKTKKYTLSGDLVQATLEECRNGTKMCGNYTFKSTEQTYEYSQLYKIISFASVKEDTYTSNVLWLKTQIIKQSKNDFSEAPTASEAGLYKAEDDLGESYYFRGNVINNYVRLGTYTENIVVYEGCYSSGDSSCGGDIFYTSMSECESNSSYSRCIEREIANEGDSMYWRIVRINGDGTIRLVYDGTELAANGEGHNAAIWNTQYNLNKDNPKYAGYTYDTSDTDKTQVDSAIKEVLDSWYDKYLETNYGKYIADGIFCNDKEISNTDETIINYAPGFRMDYYKPQLTCTNKSDRYTISSSLGNGYLSNPIGLLSADEVMFAGDTEYSNDIYYLNREGAYWTSSMQYINYGFLWGITSVSSEQPINTSASARPVINLKADVTFTGTGTMEDPYVIG